MFFISNPSSPLTKQERWLSLARAYLDASSELCERVASGSWAGSYSRGQPIVWLAVHATELFLKACLEPKVPTKTLTTHSFAKLLALFDEQYPGVGIAIPFGYYDAPPGTEEAALTEENDAVLSELFRYPSAKSGALWPGTRAFLPQQFNSELTALQAEFQRVSEALALPGAQTGKSVASDG